VKKKFISGNNAKGIVWVQFTDQDVGKITRNENKHHYKKGILPSWTSLQPVTLQFNPRKQYQVMRTQFPLRPSSAKTVHRSQGDTIDQLYVDFTGRSQPHLHYVAFSGVISPSGLKIRNFNPNKITVNNNVIDEMTRLRRSPSIPPLYQRCPASYMSIMYINAQ
jgi:hypothetical protein